MAYGPNPANGLFFVFIFKFPKLLKNIKSIFFFLLFIYF